MPPAARQRWVRKGKTQQERRRARQGISLRSLGISSKTEHRYLTAVAKVLPILEPCTSLDLLDPLCEDWIEHEWVKGTPLGLIGDALSGLHFFWPQVKGWLKGSWKLYKNWRKIEVPQRAAPLPLSVCKALVGLLLETDQVSLAFLIALGFHTYLRTGELLRLRMIDITATSSQGVVTIRASKTGLRFNIDEAVTILDPTLLQLWGILCTIRRRDTSPLWRSSAQAFRQAFHDCLATLDLHRQGFHPYSLRRGGATFHYMRKCTMEAILLRGRWRSLGVARLYLEDGLATLQQLQFSPLARQLIQQYSSGFSPSFLQ